MTKKLLMGNDAIALGLALQGCRAALAYPGTPSSEIIPSLKSWRDSFGLSLYIQWAVNEKVAFETAYTISMTGLRSAVAMKQVGLNVASDPLMSAAYMGVKGGFILISADDPGPHSSQTEQDSRMMAMMAKVPVLDPSSPSMAKGLIEPAYKISETFQIPVMLRPTTRVCHASQDISVTAYLPINTVRTPAFQKEPARWATTPKFRYLQHKLLNEKLQGISEFEKTSPLLLNRGSKGGIAIVSSGVASAHLLELIMSSPNFRQITLYQVLQPFPLHCKFIEAISRDFESILVIEETSPVIEMQIARRDKTRGRLDGFVPAEGELLPEGIEKLVRKMAVMPEKAFSVPAISTAGRRPSLCPGCPHRAAFYAIKKTFPPSRSIYTSDIGCYTLGINLKAIDTFICMGGAISQASGFYHAYNSSDVQSPTLVATMGDSTFFHAGIPALIDAVSSNVQMVLVMLDNSTTAMTGNQPTPASAMNSRGRQKISIEKIVKGSGVSFCRIGNPYDFKSFSVLLKKAQRASSKGVAVVISRAPCLMDKTQQSAKMTIPVCINERCDGCGYCVREFECPALIFKESEKKTSIDYSLCSHCGACRVVCPKGAIVDRSS